MRGNPLSADFGMVPGENATHAYNETGTIKGFSARVYGTTEMDGAVLVLSPHWSRIERVVPASSAAPPTTGSRGPA
jgi:hypothetical protein